MWKPEISAASLNTLFHFVNLESSFLYFSSSFANPSANSFLRYRTSDGSTS
ncbi:hypothetical protein RND71_039638 [Anisodus tanguticus]|uniref:Uncharacterized protein n=1 Tax=Anisodus tanguticus TaxID=243964 RepID=A0AAE1US65_9SOLA|nr:hypothetical protein RND71_039638 [Anisodus tanguticus]